MKNKINNISEIYQSCKRGMLELDLILITFVEREYLYLSEECKKEFLELLNESDQKIFNLILNKEKSKKFENILNKIKQNNNLFKFK